MEALPETRPGVVTITASAPGYADAIGIAIVRPAVVALVHSDGDTVPLRSPGTRMSVQVGFMLDAQTFAMQTLRPAGDPLRVTVRNGSAAVGHLDGGHGALQETTLRSGPGR